MKAARIFAIMVLAFCFIAIVAIATGHGQTISCETQVSVNADISSVDVTGLTSAGARLQEQGADPRFLIVKLAPFPTPEALVDSLRKQCTSWQSPNGGVKANMLVFVVAPKERKMAIFYGPSYASALGGQVDRIKRDFMAPRFKGGDWAGGLEAGANQVVERIKASVDESNKPVTYTTTNEATDFHGLWIFLWILGGLAIGGLILLVYYSLKKAKEQIQTAQQEAVASRSRAVDLLSELNDEIKKYSDIAVAPPGVKAAIPIIDTASQQLAVLGASLSGDPTTEGMSKAFYESLDDSYTRIENKLNPPPAPTPTTVIHEREVVVRDNSNDFLTGMLVDEALHSSERVREPEPEPERHSHRHDNDDSSSPSSSSDWGGSSSSFGSGSDWGGGSSDSGSGGGGFGGDSSSF